MQTATQTHPQDEGDRNSGRPISFVASISGPHREPAEAVLAALGSDAARGLSSGRSPTASGATWAEPVEKRAGHALVAAAARAIQEFSGDHPARGHSHLDARMVAAGSARDGPALRGHRHPGDCGAQRLARFLPGGAGRALGAGADGARCARIGRWFATASASASRPTRSFPATSCWWRRGTGKNSRRRSRGRGGEFPYRRGAAHRREHAGVEGRSADRCGRRHRRPPQYAVLQHGRHQVGLASEVLLPDLAHRVATLRCHDRFNFIAGLQTLRRE